MELQKKVLSFEFILKELLEWYDSSTNNSAQNDLSILKSLKLLFFVSAAKASSNLHSILLEDTFSSFVAMPYGHVESEIYTYIRVHDGELNYFKINNKSTTLKEGVNLEELSSAVDSEIRREVVASISYLKESYPFLILLSAYELVNLSHAWYSWQSFYRKATQQSSKSCPIPPEVIKKEDKIFSLQTY